MLKKFLIGTFVALALMVTSTAFAAYDFGPSTLKVGSKGVYVSTLQTFVGATSDGSFGPMTKAKVVAWQASNGLTADGLFGNLSKAKANSTASVFPAGCTNASGFSTITGGSCASVNANTFSPAGCTSASGFSPVTGGACVAVNANTLPAGCVTGAAFSATTGASCTGAVVVTNNGPLQGGAGTISAIETSTDVNNYMVEGQSDVKVLGFKVQATDSDAKISNVKVTLVKDGVSTASSYLDRYVSNVSVWMNGTKIATANAADFSKDSTGNYSKSIALDSSVVRMGVSNKATFYVTISGISNIDTSDLGATWTVTADNFRYQDATGVIMSYGPTIALTNLLDVNTINETGDVKLVMTDSSSPIAGNVKISDTSSTSDILMLSMKAKNTGADMTFDSMSFDVTAGTSPAAMIGELVLKANGTSIATWSPLSTNTTNTSAQLVAFDLDNTYTLTSGSTTLFTVEAKINNITNFITARNLTVSYDTAAATATVFEVASTRTAFNETGTVTGAMQTFYANGIVASAFTSSAPTVLSNTSGSTTSATYAISFKITASGNSYYILKSSLTAESTGGYSAATFADLSASGATLSGNYWLVNDGSTATFTTTGAITIASVSSTGWNKIGLNELTYDIVPGTTGTTPVQYSFSPTSSYETPSTLIVK